MSCRVCASDAVGPILDLGPQPLCNRYLTSPGDDEEIFPFVVEQCATCGAIQLAAPPPEDALRPRFSWIRYNEAEGHLDRLVERIWALPGVSASSTIVGVSTKDDSTLDRLRRLGCHSVWSLDPVGDLGAPAGSGIETVQARLNSGTARRVAEARGRADVVVARHILEHARDPRAFLRALTQLVKPNGYIVLEVPDCDPAFARRDYTVLWEEHVLYFGEDLFSQALAMWGLRKVWGELVPYDHENSLVAIVQPGATPIVSVTDSAALQDRTRVGAQFGASLSRDADATHGRLMAARKQGKVAVFGAGHLSCSWTNLMTRPGDVDLVVDDDPNKAGLFMPGSRLPVLPSSQLLDGVSLCLLSLSQESEQRVRARQQSFTDAGGVFKSIFPGRGSRSF